MPGDSKCDLLIPDREGGHQQPFKGSRFHHPKKVTSRIARYVCVYMFVCFFGWKHAHRVCSKLYLILKAANEGFPKIPEVFLSSIINYLLSQRFFSRKKGFSRCGDVCFPQNKYDVIKGKRGTILSLKTSLGWSFHFHSYMV